MTTPATDHATHDLLLVAAHLDGSLDAREATRVHDWLTSCADCIELRADLVAIASATRTMSTPPRPRDFTLSVADADRARAGGWRRALAIIASPRDHVTRPLAVGLTTLGIAGLLVANIPTAALFGGAANPGAAPAVDSSRVETTGSDAGSSTAAGATAATGAAVPGALDPAASPEDVQLAPVASPLRDAALGGAESGRGTDKQALGDQLTQTPAAPTGPSLLVVGSILLLATGLALALMRWGARRLGDG